MEKSKETKTVEMLVYLTYQRGTKGIFAAARQVFAPQGVEGALPSSSIHRQMFAPEGVEGALLLSSTKQVQVEQLSKGKEKVQEEDLGDEEEIDFDLIEHEEPQQHFTHHGVDIIDLEARDEETVKGIIIQEREAQIQDLVDNLERAKFVIKCLE